MKRMSQTARLRIIGRAVSANEPATSNLGELRDWIVRGVPSPDHAISYLVLAVLYGSIPNFDLIKAFTRRWRIDGLGGLIDHHLARSRRGGTRLPIRVESGVIVDVTDTSRSKYTTGIQRVARETLTRWHAERPLTLVAWRAEGEILVTLSSEEVSRVLIRGSDPATQLPREFILPFRATVVLPEISVSAERTARLRTIARFSGGRSVAIGFDCIPVTTAETAGAGMPGAFSKYLSMLARFDAIAPISSASAHEYKGWRRMLSGAGLVGPDIREISLPFAAGTFDEAHARKTRSQLGLDDTRIVLSVGSHEPRKNHLNLLHAAEIAWRAGEEFSLVLVGGNAWDTDRFDQMVVKLRRAGRRIVQLSGVEDEVIWDLYGLAEFSVFCSLNEGFGLPVVESLSIGTPVITSNFGSMRELGEGRGALLVNPRDVDQLAAGMINLLSNQAELKALTEMTSNLPVSSWQTYADELWDFASAPNRA